MTDPREPSYDPSRLGAEDRRLVETLRRQLDPGERTPAQRAAFQARLEERLDRSGRSPWRALALAASTAVAAAALWLAVPPATPNGDGAGGRTAPAETASLLAYAYYETDYLVDGDGPGELLSDEYQAIATAFEVF